MTDDELEDAAKIEGDFIPEVFETERQVEALLFAAAEPLSLADLADRLAPGADVAAALAALMDVVIAVDTAVAHLAGALGKPVWILNRYDTCWRWLENRSDSPWYPSARLFRQREPGIWTPVIEAVRQALTDLAAERR